MLTMVNDGLEIVAKISTGIELIKIINDIYTLRKQLNDNQEACLLLCDRVRIFDSWLQEWAGKDRFPDNASLEMSIQSLLTLLTEIREFVKEITLKEDPNESFLLRLTKKVLGRQTVAESLSDFHQRIDQCASTLNICLTMSAEDKRREEMVALHNELNAHSDDLIGGVWALKRDSGKLKELLEGLREDVGEGNSAILKEIKALQQKVESQAPLSLGDLIGLEKSLNASNEALAAKMDKHYEEVVRVREEVMAARQTGEVILEKVNEVNVMMKKLLEDQALTKAEEQYRGKLLKKLLIPSGKVRVIEGGIKLGAGGFGEVYVALYQNKQVAVKSFFSLRGSTTAMTQRDIAAVENEVLLMGGYLGPHPTIVSCYGYFKDEHQNISMVLELAPYGCLLSLLEDHERFPILSFRLVLGWLNDAIGALSFIHEHEVKHRDVKADNLLVFHNLHVKLCDFGLAKQHSCEKKESTSARGTSSFMAPEVIEGKGSSYASDVFAWAMTAMQMILRRVPDRSRRSLSSLMGEVMGSVRGDQDLITLSSSAEVASGFEKLLTQCLQSKPTNRPSASTVSDLAQDMLTKTGGEEKSRLAVPEVTSLSSPMKEEAASSPSSSKESTSIKRKLSSLSHEDHNSRFKRPKSNYPGQSMQVVGFSLKHHEEQEENKEEEKKEEKEEEEKETFSLVGSNAVKRELSSLSYKEATELLISWGFSHLKTVDGSYLNGVTEVEHLHEIGETMCTPENLKTVVDDLQRYKREGVPVDTMQAIRRNLLIQRIKGNFKRLVESGDVSTLQELRDLKWINKIPAEDINQSLKVHLNNLVWGRGQQSALHLAAGKGNIEMARLLLLHSEIDVNNVNNGRGCTPVMFACAYGHVEMVEMLLSDSRVDINKQSNVGTSLFYAACCEGRVEVVKSLLQNERIKKDATIINLPNVNGWTPFYSACKNNFEEVVNVLLKDTRVGFYPVTTKEAWTPLYVACNLGHEGLVEILLEFYENRQEGDVMRAITKDDGFTPLIAACYYGRVNIVEKLLQYSRMKKEIIDMGNSVGGGTAFYWACKNGHINVVNMLLLDDRVDETTVNKKNNVGQTPFFAACAASHKEVVDKLLLDSRVDINKENEEGKSPLDIVAGEMRQRLSERGAREGRRA